MFPAGPRPLPVTSDLNPQAHDAIANLVIVQIGAGDNVDVYNSVGMIDVVLDVQGWFAPETTLLDPRTGMLRHSRCAANAHRGLSVSRAQGAQVTLALRDQEQRNRRPGRHVSRDAADEEPADVVQLWETDNEDIRCRVEPFVQNSLGRSLVLVVRVVTTWAVIPREPSSATAFPTSSLGSVSSSSQIDVSMRAFNSSAWKTSTLAPVAAARSPATLVASLDVSTSTASSRWLIIGHLLHVSGQKV